MDLFPLWGKWVLQGVVTFAVGLLPFSITSQSLLASLTTFGAGRLLGSALFTFLGITFMGALSTSLPGLSEVTGVSPPVLVIIHVVGIVFMLVAERRLSSRTALNTSRPGGLHSNTPSSPLENIEADDDMESRETMEQTHGLAAHTPSASRPARLEVLGPHQRRVYLFIIAFVVGEVMGGVRSGYLAMVPPRKPDDASDRGPMPPVPSSVTLFLINLAEEGVTTLGFATTLLSASLPIAECKRHVLLYAAARPLAALLSYNITRLSRIVPPDDRPFIAAMSFFMDGIFVYAALIVRALIANSRTTARSGLFARVSLMAAGALLPYVLPMLVWIGRLWYHAKFGRDTGEVA